MSTPAPSPAERVYALTNAADGNAVAVFVRQGTGTLLPLTADPAAPAAADFSIRPLPAFPTGGLGSGATLLASSLLTLSDDGRFLFAVNPGSNDVTSFLVTPSGLHFVSKVSSGGVLPMSVTSLGNLVYVVNAVSNFVAPVTPGVDGSGTGQIAGFTVGLNGVLTPLEGSIRPLGSPNSSPAQIGFNADGTLLIVTEFLGRITVFHVEEDGRPGDRVENQARVGSFGFAFNSRGVLIVSEAGPVPTFEGSVSSYKVDSDGKLTAITRELSTNQVAACWIANTSDARYSYSSNTGSPSISGFNVSSTGELTLLDADGRTGLISDFGVPIDMVISGDDRYLDVLTQGTQTITTFRIEQDGSLTLMGCVGNLPPLAVGLAIS